MSNTVSNWLFSFQPPVSPENITDPKTRIHTFCKSWKWADCMVYLQESPSGQSSESQATRFREELTALVEAVYRLDESETTGCLSSRSQTEISAKRESSPLDPDTKAEFESFFTAYSLREFTDRLYYILEAYAAPDYYQKGSPSDVLYALERLYHLVRAAHGLYQGLADTELLPRVQRNNFSFPTLAPQTPQDRIRSFFEDRTLEEWDSCIRHVLFFALSKDDPEEGGAKEDTLYLYTVFRGLVEACHQLKGS